MNRNITYGIERETGIVYSRVGRECAGPVLDFEVIGKGGTGDDGIEYAPGDFNGPTRYHLEKMSIYDVYRYCRWTKQIPVRIKNRHRAFWGFKPLPEPGPDETAAHALITELTQAAGDEAAQAIAGAAKIRVVRAAADLLHINAEGHGTPWLRRAVAREARA